MSLKGSLETVGVADVLTLLASTGKTGELQVTGSTREGRVWVKDGQLIASDAGKGPSHIDAVFELLRVGTGSFSFDDGRTPDEAGQATDIAPLLSEATERLTQWREIEVAIPSLACIVGMTAVAPDDEVIIRADQWRMLASTGGGRPVADVLESMELGEFDGCKALKELADGRLITVEEPQDVVAEPDVVVAEPDVVVAEPDVVVAEEPVAAAEEAVVADDVETPEPYVRAEVSPLDLESSEPHDIGGVDLSPVNHGGGEVDLSVVGTPGAAYEDDESGSPDGDQYAVVNQAAVDEDAVDQPNSSPWPQPTVSPESVAPASSTTFEPYRPVDGDRPADGAYDDQPSHTRGARRERTVGVAAEIQEASDGQTSPDDGANSAATQTEPATSALTDPDGVATSGTDATDPPDPNAAAEEPINRGLLLKFLSSVRS